MEQLIELVKSTKQFVFKEHAAQNHKAKGDFDYVTQVDIEIERYMKENLKKLTPGIQFMGEEEDSSDISLDKPVWILDPIDGTTNLIHSYPQCAVSLGLMADGKMVEGVIYNPFNDQIFYAKKGSGAFCNGERIHVSDTGSLHGSLIAIGVSPYDKDDSENDFKVIREIFMQCQDLRRCGSAALQIAYVAAGISEAYFEKKLKPWDYGAGLIILEEAGGHFTTVHGSPVECGKPSSILATNGKIHEDMLAYTKNLRI